MNLYEFRYWLEGYREGWEDKTCPTKDQWKRILDKLYFDRDQQPTESEPTIKWEYSPQKFYDYNPYKNIIPVYTTCDTSRPVTYYNQKQNGSK